MPFTHLLTSPPLLTDLIASYLISNPEEKQEILSLFDIKERIDKLLELLNYQIEVLKLSNKINQQTQETMGQRQREFVLCEQMKTIQKELGEGEGNTIEITEFNNAITAAKMPEDVEKQARKELARLQHMQDASGEYSMLCTYLDWLIELPLLVGGIKEKVIAAARAGINTVMLPKHNQSDFEEIPEEIRKKLNFVWLEKIDDLLAIALKK